MRYVAYPLYGFFHHFVGQLFAHRAPPLFLDERTHIHIKLAFVLRSPSHQVFASHAKQRASRCGSPKLNLRAHFTIRLKPPGFPTFTIVIFKSGYFLLMYSRASWQCGTTVGVKEIQLVRIDFFVCFGSGIAAVTKNVKHCQQKCIFFHLFLLIRYNSLRLCGQMPSSWTECRFFVLRRFGNR